MEYLHRTLQRKFLVSITLIIVPVLGIVFAWTAYQSLRQARAEALDKARIISRQVVLTRQWVTDCGGSVLVPAQSPGAMGVAAFCDVQTQIAETAFRRFSPAMVTRQLSRYSSREKGYSFSLSSLHPINPDNRPNRFEKNALETFIRDKRIEAYQFGARQLAYMVPLYLAQGCLRCHQQEEIEPMGIIGGLSVLIPLEKTAKILKKNVLFLLSSGICLTLLTIGTLFVLMRKLVIRPLEILETKTRQIRRGNLDARVHIATGDELERLGKGFNTMADALARSRQEQEKRIAQATRELACAHAKLQALDRMKSDFLTNMSHELRSPLTVIRGGINYLQRTVENDVDQSYVRIMDKNISRLTRLVSDMFDFTKLEAGKIEWDFNRENISNLVREVIEITSPLADEKQLAVTCFSPEQFYVSMDIERMEQVLVNIMDNAIKFSDPGTEIRVQVARHADTVTVSVMDHGPGIAPENIEQIFDKFSTVPTGRNCSTEGTGLGLAISKAIVQAHGGNIRAESVVGESTTFYLELPAWIDDRQP